MSKLKIGIVEDEMIIAEAISEMLKAIGYETTEPVAHYSEAIEMIENQKPDLLLVDINLAGKLSGIDLAKTINQAYKLPFIFLTANTDADTIQQAKLVKPSAYLAKPITREQLFSAIEIAISNFSSDSRSGASDAQMETPPRDVVFVKDGYAFRKVHLSEITYLESEANYVTLHIHDGSKFLVRSTLTEFSGKLDKSVFVRVHRSFVVNVNHIDGVYPAELSLKTSKVPVSKIYKEDLMRLLGISGQ